MKALIAYYSKTGNTDRLASIIKEKLEKRSYDVDVEKIRCSEKHSFLGWLAKRIFGGRCEIKKPKISNVSAYDIIFLGSPNWIGVSPPIKKYIKWLKGFNYKKTAFFATTYLSPILEWAIFSGYLLEAGFSKLIKENKNILVASLLVSGKQLRTQKSDRSVEEFIENGGKTIVSLKEYNLKQLDYENAKTLAVFFVFFLILTVVAAIALFSLGARINFFNFFAFLFLPGVASYFLVLFLIKEKKLLFSVKYVASLLLTIIWFGVVFFLPSLIADIFVLGMVLIIAFISIFRDPLAVVFSGAISFVAYFSFLSLLPTRGNFYLPTDGAFILLTTVIISLISYRERKNYITLLDSQEETEIAKTTLEIRVAARVRELKELADALDQKVKKRTKELRQRLVELEKFQRLMIGREEKMIKLKEEIKEAKKELTICREKLNGKK